MHLLLLFSVVIIYNYGDIYCFVRSQTSMCLLLVLIVMYTVTRMGFCHSCA